MYYFSKFLKKTVEPLLFCALIALAIILCLDKRYSAVVLEGVSLWAACVLPALFPYFFITAILSSLNVTGKLANKFSPLTKRVFNVGGLTGYAFFISVISGYPVGAKTVADLSEKGLLGKAESVRAATLCSNPSPMFLIGSVGNITFGNFKFGLFLFFTCLISSIATGIIFSLYKRKEKPSVLPPITQKRTDNLLYDTAYSSVISVLTVGGLITVFYTLSALLNSVGVLTPINLLFSALCGNAEVGEGITLGILESTTGLKAISRAGVSFWTLPICATLCGFGGLSVIAQSLAYLKKTKIKTAVFLLAKAVTAVICFSVGILFSLFL